MALPKVPAPKPPAFVNSLGMMAGKTQSMGQPQMLAKKERLMRSLMGGKTPKPQAQNGWNT